MKLRMVLVAGALMVASGAHASNSTEKLPDEAKMRLKELGMEINYSEKTAVAGPVYSLGTDKGVVYSTSDGKYVFVGKLFKVENNQVSDLTEETVVKGVRNFVRSTTAITFKSPQQKYEVAVFTDITCGFCQQLHREVNEYLAKGITLHFLAFPRGGIASVSAENMAKIWCAEDPSEALTNAMTLSKLPDNKASDACRRTVASQFEIGNAIPVQGTPTIVPMTGNAQVMPGYISPTSLIKLLSDNDLKSREIK